MPAEPGSIVVVSGPIGAGKTTIARALVQSADSPLAYIEGDDFWRYLVKPRPGGPRTNIQAIMRAMFRSAAAIAGDGYGVILDFSIPPDFLERAAARASDTPVHLVVIRPSFEVCAERAATRAEGVISDYGPYRDFYAMFEVAERHLVRNDALSPAEAAEIIREGLASGRFRFGAETAPQSRT